MRLFFHLFFFFICFMALSLHRSSPVFGEEITVIISQDLPIYRQALLGFKKVFPGKVKEVDLKGDPGEAVHLIPAIKKHPGDLVVSIGLLATQIVKENIKQTSKIFCMVYNPERFSFFGQEMTGVRLEVSLPDTFSRMKELFPDIKKVGVFYDPKKTGKVIDQSKEIAKEFGISLVPVKVSSEKDLPEGLRSLPGNIDLLWMIPDSTVVTPLSLNTILLTSFKNNIPIMTFSEDFVKKGAVAALSSDNEAIGEEVGHLALKILQGELPSHFPIHSVSKSNLFINLKIARKMGVKLNPETVRKAIIVYE